MRILKSDPAKAGSSRAVSSPEADFPLEERDIAACLGCLREAGKVDFSHRTVIETKFFHVHQDCEVPIPGFFIVDFRRHVASIADFTAEEAHAFIDLVMALRRGMRRALKIRHVYLFQNEDSRHHFHLWMFPRYPWMERFGRHIESVRPIIEEAKRRRAMPLHQRAVDRAISRLRNVLQQKDAHKMSSMRRGAEGS